MSSIESDKSGDFGPFSSLSVIFFWFGIRMKACLNRGAKSRGEHRKCEFREICLQQRCF